MGKVGIKGALPIPPLIPLLSIASMPDNAIAPELESLTNLSAADVKKSWRSVVGTAASKPVLMTNHGQPVAVILSPEQYVALVRGSQQAEEPIDALARRFDERMAVLSAPDAGDRLRSLGTAAPAEIGRVAETPLLAG